MHESPFLNLYAYPGRADYRRIEPLAPTWHRLDSTIRATDGDWSLPEHLACAPGRADLPVARQPGSADVELMQRLVDMLGRTEHRVIVSKGPLADQIRLHDNMTGEAFLPSRRPAAGRSRDHARRQQHRRREVPQRQADGRAAAVLGPGRQRPADPRDGVRPPAVDLRFADEELTGAIDALLADTALRERMAGIAARMQAARGTERAADLIERVATTHAPVLRAA